MKFARDKWFRAGRWTGVCLIWVALAWMGFAQTIITTTVQGTVYLANGKPGAGTVQLSWPAFTTAGNQTVMAGRTTATIGADGFLSVNLAPNLGSSPAGLFYTAIYYMSDGTASTEYWVVPATAQASIAQVRSQVMPAAQAVQAVNKAYVDQAIQLASQSSISPLGGTLTGPLYLSGDPSQALQAADKHYVDSTFSLAVPMTGASLTGPLTSVQLGAAFQVDQFPGADFGAKLQACLVTVSATYGGTCDARNFTGNQSMASNLTISTANTTVMLPCATISTAKQLIVSAGTRNVALRGCALRGASSASGSQGGTVLLYSGAGAMVQVGDPTYAVDTPGFHLDNVVINTTASASSTAQGLAAYRTQEMDLQSLYFLGNSNQTGMTLDGTGNYTGGTFYDNAFNGFQTAVNAIGHRADNSAATDWLNASAFVRLHIDCPTSGGSPISGTYGINLQQGDGNTFTGGDVEGCDTALHLGANAQNNTIVGLRNENSNSQVVADSGSAYNNWMTGGTMFTGQLTDNGTRNSFLDTFHRSFNGINGDWYGSQKDATVTNHFRIGIGAGNERGILNRYQTDSGYRWTTGLSDATAGEQFYQVLDELNNVYRLSIGQYNSGQPSTNNQTVVNAAGSGAVVLNGSNDAGTGGVVIGSGGPSETTVATINNAGNAQFNGTLQVGGSSTFSGSTTVRNQADSEIDAFLWAGATASQKESFTYKDYTGASQWYMVKDAGNNWALNSALGGLDSFKAYQSTNSGDTYINASNPSGVVRVNYEAGAGAGFNIYGGTSSKLYASFTGTNAIKFPGLAATSGSNCLQIDSSGYVTNTGAVCSTGNNGTVNTGAQGQIAYYSGSGTALNGMSAVPVTAGGTGATTAAGALTALSGASLATVTAQSFAGTVNAPSVNASVNKVLLVTAPPYNAKCDGSTDDQTAIQAAFTDAQTLGYSIQFPAGTCKTSTITWYGQSFFGAGITQTVIKGMPGQDVFATPDSGAALTFGAYVHDMTVNVDSSVDKSATAAGGDNTFPNRISGTAGGLTPISATYGGPPAPGGMHYDGSLVGNCYGSMTNGSPTFTLSCSYFTSVWSALIVGQPITVSNAGTSGGLLTTTVSAVVDSTHLTLAASASTTTTTATGNIGNGLVPPWYFGNCGFALPASSGAAMAGTNGWIFRNIQLQTTGSPGVGGNHTCGMFFQASQNNDTFDNVSAIAFYGGIIEAPPASNNTSYYAYTPDTNIYTNVNIKWSLLPMVWYNGVHRVVHGLSMYQAHRPFATGLWQIGSPLGSSATAYPSATIAEYYNEGWGLNSGEGSRFYTQGGLTDNITGSLGVGGTSYVNWLGSGGTVNGGFQSNLRIVGSENTFLNTALQAGNVTDLGFDNKVQTGFSAADTTLVRSWYNNPTPPQEPVGKLDGGFVLSGNTTTPFVSASDLVTTCRDYRQANVSPYACVNDPGDTGNPVASYIHTDTTGFGTTNPAYTPLFGFGTRIPQTKVYVVMMGECEGSSSCSTTLQIKDVTTSTQIGSNCTVTFGATWTVDGGPLSAHQCLIDFSASTYGHVLGFTETNWTGSPTGTRTAFIAFEPVPNDVIQEAATSSSVQGQIQTGAGGTPVNITAATWKLNGGPGSVDLTSPVGYSSTVGGGSSLSQFGASTNLKGGALYPAVNSTVSVLAYGGSPVITDTLGGAMLVGDTTMTLTTATTSAWGAAGYLQVDQEYVHYSGVSAGLTTITITRGQLGTLAQAHSSGAAYNSVGQSGFTVACNGTNYASFNLVFGATWTNYSAPFAGQNCSGYTTTFLVGSTVGPTGQVYKLAGIQIAQNVALPAPTAASQVPVSVGAGPYTWTSAKALAGAGAGITTGPTTSVDGDVVTHSGTVGQVKDSGVLLTALAKLVSPAFTTPSLGVATATSVAASGALSGASVTDSGVLSASVVGTSAAGLLQASTTHNLSVPANCNAASASGTAYTCTTAPTFTPASGDHIQFKADVANTGSATLAVNGAAAAPIKKLGGSGLLVANDMLAGHWISATFDGTNWQLEGQLGNAVAPLTSLPLTGTTASIGGSALAAGVCVSGTATVTNSTTSMVADATPATYPGDSITWRAYVSAAGTVTVKVCNETASSATPTASAYNVRIVQ